MNPRFWILACALISGFSVIYNASAVKGTDPIAFVTLKNAIAAVAVLAVILALGSWKSFAKLTKQQWIKLLAIAFVGGSIPFALFFTGLSLVSSGGMASFTYRILFFFAAGFAAVFLKEKINARFAAGVALLLVANALLLNNISFGPGEALVLLATLMWAAEGVLSKQALSAIAPDVVASVRLGAGSILLFGALLLTGRADGIISGAIFGAPALLSAAFLTLYVLTWYRGLARLPLSEATALLSLGGLVSVAAPALMAGRMPGLFEGASAILLLAGTMLVLGSARLRQISDEAVLFLRSVPAIWKA